MGRLLLAWPSAKPLQEAASELVVGAVGVGVACTSAFGAVGVGVGLVMAMSAPERP